MKPIFKISKSLILSLICATMIFNLVACANIESNELTAKLRKHSELQSPAEVEADEAFVSVLTEFSVELFKQTAPTQGDNSVLSPLSAMVCLSMMANGADGNTLAELETVLGMDIEALNGYLYTYLSKLEQSSKIKFDSSNSMWLKNDGELHVKQEFLENAVRYYDAEVFASAFDDKTADDINNWVKKKTDGEIKKFIENVDPDTVMYLINTLLFEAEWRDPVNESAVRDGTFNNSDGSTSTVSMMSMLESYYFKHDGVMGFKKGYNGSSLSFVGFLPDERTDVSEFIASLDAAKWAEILDSQTYANVNLTFPMFEIESKTDLKAALINMGIEAVFSSSESDLSKLGSYSGRDIYCSFVGQKATIKVDKNGTKATAATEIQMNPTSAEPPKETVELVFDRPFVYAILDSSGIPIFIGAVNELG